MVGILFRKHELIPWRLILALALFELLTYIGLITSLRSGKEPAQVDWIQETSGNGA